MPFWFSRKHSDGTTEIVGPFEQHDEAIDTFQADQQADISLGVFNAFNDEYAESITIRHKDSCKTSSSHFGPELKSTQNELPVRLRPAYKEGLKGGCNPYPLNSQEFNDFERARDKGRMGYRPKPIADPRLYAEYQANKNHIVGSEAWRFDDDRNGEKETARKVREVLKYKDGS
ncbi:hypothetical protein [Vibrio europaeus]|uniref:hypothetical protein n=1 Tax=Vibrio europaeus TaxID=300876 RepID=UPI00233EDAC0|nr:hypothetical protein [Vibrio europaeus]MDC5855514.1 hypothetical protein [Vibrio europaeus]